MDALLFAVLGMALLAHGLWVRRVILGMEAKLDAPQRPSEGPVTATPPQYDDLELRSLILDVKASIPAPYDDTDLKSQMQTLTAALAEGILHHDRNNRRIEAVVRRARKELAEHGLEHPGLEAEIPQLQIFDGGGGEEEGVPEVPTDVGEDAAWDEPSGAPGFTKGQLAALRAARESAQ